MREFKFRVWDKDHKRFTNIMLDYPIIALNNNEIDKRFIFIQYTGLKDINGVEIYEGDIIPFHFDENVRGIVKFGEYKNPCDDKFSKHQGFYIDFYGESKDYYRKDLGYWASLSKVIGNRYENPELLEGIE